MTLSPKLVHKNDKQAQLDTWPRSNQSNMGRPLTRPHAHTHTNITNIPPGEKRASPREEREKNQMIIIMYKRKTEEEEEEEEEEEREIWCVSKREKCQYKAKSSRWAGKRWARCGRDVPSGGESSSGSSYRADVSSGSAQG